jgi:titin
LVPSTDVLIGYHVYRGNTSGTEAAVPIMNGTISSAITLSSLEYFIATDNTVADDVNHYYYVTTENLFGNSTPSNEAVSFASTTGDVPDPVSNLAAVGGSGQVTLTWDKPTYQGTANLLIYTIFRSNGTVWFPIQLFAFSGLEQQTYVDNTTLAGTAYQYYVMVSNLYGEAAAPSNIVQASATSSNVVPSAPVNLVTTAGTGYVLLSWSAPTTVGPGITSYKIFRATTSGGEGSTVFANVSGSVLSYNDTSVVPGLPYYYEVAAVNSVGTGPDSNEAVGTAPAPSAPTAPVNLTAFAGQGEIILNWSAPTSVGTGITEYRIYRGTTAGGEGTTPIATVTGTTLTYIDSNILSGGSYTYEVKAVNSAGVGPGSNEVAVTALTIEGIPNPPTFLTAVAGNGYVLLNWTAPTNVGGSAITAYKVYRGASASGESSVPIANLTSTIRAYNDSSVTNQVPYYYVVKAVNTNGTSNPSNEVLATPINPGLPSAPKNVVATPGAGKIVVTWDAPDSIGASAITGYSLFRSDNGSQLTLLATTGATTTAYTDTAVVPGHSYGYQVVAKNANGNGTVSTTVTAIPNPNAGPTSTDNTLLYAGIIVVVLAVIGGGAFLFLRRKK